MTAPSPSSDSAAHVPGPDRARRIRIRIDLDVLRRNAQAVRRHLDGRRAMFVVKNDAYGHGASVCAKTLECADLADYLAVANVAEGLELRRACVVAPILVFGLADEAEACEAADADLTLTVIDPQGVSVAQNAAAARNRSLKIHLEIDTGMGRFGLEADGQTETLALIGDSASLEFEGVYSHLASADTDREMSVIQARRFAEFVQTLPTPPPLTHFANSAGILIPQCAAFDMARSGLALYGASRLYDDTEPAMTAVSHLVQVRDFKPGRTVGYGATFPIERPMRIGVVNAGYGDGLLRSLSNAGTVWVRGRPAPIAGRLCMDQFMVDLSEAPEASPGDDVFLFGRLGELTRPAWELADEAGTLSYELTTQVGRLATVRNYVGEQAS